MSTMTACLWVAGGLQALIASANIFAPRLFQYRENLARVSPIVREIFIVQNVFLVLLLVCNAAMCLLLTDELLSGSRLARAVCGFFAGFWLLRFIVQVFLYDACSKRRFPKLNIAFLATFSYLAVLYLLVTLD